VTSPLLNILILGDVVGRPGRFAVANLVPALVAERRLDLVVANVENVADGSGLTPTLYQKLLGAGVDVMTMGDHAFRRREIFDTYQTSPRLIRPANFPPEAVGKGVAVVRTRSASGEPDAGTPVAVISLMGQMHMRPSVDSPFACADRLLAGLPPDVKVRLVDFHAEITAEKIAMGRHLAGRVSAVVGTHTHVQTADEQLLPGGTAYLTDLGMTGPHDGVLGRRADRVLKSMLTGMPQAFDVSEGDPRLNGVIVRIDPATGRAEGIERVSLPDTRQVPGARD
jgi:metallophosphoesterase (TIGR00282 family)